MRIERVGIVMVAAMAIAIGVATMDNAVDAGAFQDASQLIAQFSPDAPEIDGVVDAAWDSAPAIETLTVGGANAGTHAVTIKSLYSGDRVYFLVQWTDPTYSQQRFPWVKQADGSWMQLNDGSDHDETQFYEDKFAFIWNINNSISGFNQAGCGVTCHAGEANKAYGNKYTPSAGEIGDIWHWKSVRSNPEGYIDDQYVNADRWSEDNGGAGRHGDASDGGGYFNNKNEDGTGPAFMSPNGANSGYWIKDSQKVEFVDTFVEGDEVAGIVVNKPVGGDRADIDGFAQYNAGMWTLEIGRKLVTGSETDVQFDDMNAAYYFGVAAFDNAQVRHAFQPGVSSLTFGVRPTAVASSSWGEVKNSMGK
ncbi:MAG: hypothetical protein ACI8P2_002183 [Candidatus Latescibacterota bacterium]|jgi:hypothetical protein